MTWGGDYTQRKEGKGSDCVEHVSAQEGQREMPNSGRAEEEGRRRLRKAGEDWAARVLLQSYSGHGQLDHVREPRERVLTRSPRPTRIYRQDATGQRAQQVAGQHPWICEERETRAMTRLSKVSWGLCAGTLVRRAQLPGPGRWMLLDRHRVKGCLHVFFFPLLPFFFSFFFRSWDTVIPWTTLS